MATGNREFVRKHPIATKRALRAILKAADICALEPELAARALVDGGFTPRYDYALQTMQDVPYNKWRVYDPEDSVRFYALRLREAGMIKSAPQRLIAQGTDWRFLNELKKELKG
jgi:NitT/TauT family transport system substrate-binding protein